MTVALLAVLAGTVAVAGPAAREGDPDRDPAGRQIVAGAAAARPDRRPEGVAASPYALEIYETSVATRPVFQGDPATFDLYGFKLGMSVREAERNARRLHLRFNGGDFTNPSFDGRVAVRVAGLLGTGSPKIARVLGRTSMADSDGNHYLLEFLPMEAGATLSSVAYIGSWEGNSPADYMAALQGRYGRPSSKDVGQDRLSARWCSKGDTLALCNDRPAFVASGSDKMELSLFLGNRARTELDRRIETKAAAAAATERRKPSF